ncbi:curli assembly protein CsgF [Azoarcus sp. DN11]|uniref:curli assembly protein CsgF n=1 Tax=Azoarcus sp. DN11 TaxID=356837 RepID=UPI000EAF0999|nr:curli assembly protein CsgF [Azoarcus sp. DN11]AYH44652.1 curli assembly protein CsgF [Azoarcus sp. DN11]
MKHRQSKGTAQIFAVMSLCGLPSAVLATNLVYTPVNPAFGGNPINGSVLLNNANAQNRHTDPSAKKGASGFKPPTALETFNQRLQSMILDRIATSVTGSIFDSNGKLKAGTVETDAFSVSIVDLGGGMLKITTMDKATGASSTFEIGTAP